MGGEVVRVEFPAEALPPPVEYDHKIFGGEGLIVVCEAEPAKELG